MGRFKFPQIEEPSLRVRAKRYFLSIFCFFFFVFGLGVILGAAVILSRRPADCDFFQEFFPGVYLLLVAGCATAFLSLCTCLSARSPSQLSSVSLVPVCIVLIIILVVQFSAAISAHVMYVSADNGRLKSLMNSTWAGYYQSGGGAGDCVDQLQEKFECCGVSGASDWLFLSRNASEGVYPSSCLCARESDACLARNGSVVVGNNNNNGSVYVREDACHGVVLGYLFDVLLIPRVLGPVLTVVEFVLAMAAAYILHHIDNRSLVGAYVVRAPPPPPPHPPSSQLGPEGVVEKEESELGHTESQSQQSVGFTGSQQSVGHVQSLGHTTENVQQTDSEGSVVGGTGRLNGAAAVQRHCRGSSYDGRDETVVHI